MYPGSGLQTEIECSVSGPPLSYNFETVQIGSADALFRNILCILLMLFFIESFCTMELVLVESADALFGIFLSISG